MRRLGHPNLTALFGHRANRTTIANWIAGRYAAPQWAIDRLTQEWQAVDAAMRADLAQTKAGPGRKAGTRNIMAYNARR